VKHQHMRHMSPIHALWCCRSAGCSASPKASSSSRTASSCTDSRAPLSTMVLAAACTQQGGHKPTMTQQGRVSVWSCVVGIHIVGGTPTNDRVCGGVVLWRCGGAVV
jgi:hypothetical protein